jgi:hypothetical protein
LYCLGWSIFYLPVHYFNSSVPIARQAGQAAVLGRLSLNLFLWSVTVLPIFGITSGQFGGKIRLPAKKFGS